MWDETRSVPIGSHAHAGTTRPVRARRASERREAGPAAAGPGIPGMTIEPRTDAAPPPHPEGGPHDGLSPEPLGAFTPDDETPLGDTPEVHDEVISHDLRPGTTARRAVEQRDRDRVATSGPRTGG